MKSTRSRGATFEQIIFTDETFPDRKLVATRFYGQTLWGAIGFEGNICVTCYDRSRDKFHIEELDILAKRWVEFGLSYL